MLVAYSVVGQDEDSQVDGRFGRCPFFALVDDEGDSRIEFIANAGANAATGAGVGAAQQLLELGVAVVVTGQIGPKAFEIFTAAGIPVYLAPASLSLAEARKSWCSGNLVCYQIQRF